MHDHQKSTWLANASVIAAMELPKCMDRNMHACMCGWMYVCLQYHYAVIKKVLITFLVLLKIICSLWFTGPLHSSEFL